MVGAKVGLAHVTGSLLVARTNALAHLDQRLDAVLGALDQVLVKCDSPLFEEDDTSRSSICEISELVSLLHVVTNLLSTCQLDGSN
jgi:hypothetical protein